LAALCRNRGTLKEYPEWITTAAIWTHEHSKNVERRHRTSRARHFANLEERMDATGRG